jgi:hypothetical protein
VSFTYRVYLDDGYYVATTAFSVEDAIVKAKLCHPDAHATRVTRTEGFSVVDVTPN